jgi:transcriptional regulator with XRE-family HTH domain
MSQEELAAAARLDRTYISGLERGVRNPALSTIERIASALQAPVWRLVQEAESRQAIESEATDPVSTRRRGLHGRSTEPETLDSSDA